MPYTFAQIEKKLKKLGFKIVRQRGSHVLFSDDMNTFPLPRHGKKDISRGVENKIIKILKIKKEKFKEL